MPIYEKLMGNPFVDAGVCGICELLERQLQPEEITIEDLRGVVRQIAPMYCQPEYLTQIRFIFPNSTVTQHSKIQRGMESLIEELKSVWLQRLDKITNLKESGDCLGCGRRSADFQLKKTEVPLSGSGNLRNFFPLFAAGVGYCAACTLAIQMAPLASVRSGGKFLILHSNSWKALCYWARVCVTDITGQAARNEFTGFFDPKYSKSQSALFYMVRGMIQYEENRSNEKITMQVFSFSNDNREPKLDIYQLPARVFNFLRYAHQAQYEESWYLIVRSGYRRQKKKGLQEIDWKKTTVDEVYQKSPNLVYNNLLQGRSILGFFLNRRVRQPRGNWDLLSLYLKEVRTMEQVRLDKIKHVGDLIAESIRKSGRDRRLGQLERAKNYNECQNVLRYVVRDRIEHGAPEPLFSLDDYVKHLFPESENFTATPWRESRNLLLFRIYEQLHDWLQEQGFVDFDEDNASVEDDPSKTEFPEEN